MRVIKKFQMRKLKHGYEVVAENFLLNYSLFKIPLNPSKKVEFSSEKQKHMSDDGRHFPVNIIETIKWLSHDGIFKVSEG